MSCPDAARLRVHPRFVVFSGLDTGIAGSAGRDNSPNRSHALKVS
jgi:hypothetical protein